MADEHARGQHQDESRQTHERFVLPLVVPAIVFLFGVLVIYGLSRIYLELDTWNYKDVGMATPLAIGIALLILAISGYMAGRPAVPRWQIAAVVLIAAGGLTGGAIWAAVHPDTEAEAQPPAATEPPAAGETAAPPGGVQVTLSEFAVEVDRATTSPGAVTFSVENGGAIIHNLRVIKTNEAPDSLPVDGATFSVDESQVDVVAKLAELDSGASETLDAQLETGSYVLICNVPTHYDAGMHTAFAVE